MTPPPTSKLKATVHGDCLRIGHVTISFHRTLRIPDDGEEYPLPPSLGYFPLCRVEDYQNIPPGWREHGGVFMPMFQREAMWLRFEGPHWRPNAVKVAVGKVNAISGKPWSEELIRFAEGMRTQDEQDYIVVPKQLWLDGINAGDGFIKQFVAMPLGMRYTVEAQVTGEERFGGLQLCVFDPKPGKFPDRTPQPIPSPLRGGLHPQSLIGSSASHAYKGGVTAAYHVASGSLDSASLAGQEMGLAAGGRMKQKIYADPHGIETWDQTTYGRVYVHLVNSAMWTTITGLPMPSTPVSAKAYTDAGYPWFGLYDERIPDVPASSTLSQVKTVKEKDAEKGFVDQQDDSSVAVPTKVHKYTADNPTTIVRDGKW